MSDHFAGVGNMVEAMKCEHCGQPAMRGFWICKRCWEIFGDDE